MAQNNKKQIPEPVRIALEIAGEFNAVSGADELKKSLPILAMKLFQNGQEVSEETLRDHVSKGIDHIKQAANDLSQSRQKKLSYDEIIERLKPLAKKPEINAWQDAARHGDLEWIKNYCKNGGDITADYNAALLSAAENGHLDVVKYCHENGIDITANCNAALLLAAENGHLDVVEYCATHGCDITELNNYALQSAAANGHLDVVKYCATHSGDITAGDNYALCMAAQNGHLDVVKYCATHGGDITADDNYALLHSAQVGHWEVVKYLHDNGAPLFVLFGNQQHRYKNALPIMEKWQRLFNNYPPAGLINHGAKAEYFKPHAFNSAVKWMNKEGYKGKEANQYAYNLSALFASEDRILRYLDKWGEEGKKTPLHDLAVGIKIPKDGNPDLKAWGDACLKFGPEMTKFVKFADKLPQPAASLNKTREIIAEFTYERGSENKELAAMCIGYSVDDEDFDDALNFYQKHERKGFKTKNIPDIKIDGAEFGKEGAKLYRLPAGDMRGLFLGEATDCCQSIGNVGAECAKHGFSSENGGFYVVTDKNDKIIAQSWAWRGTNREMVLDSLETLGTQLNAKNWKLILEAMTRELAKDYPKIKGLYVGTGGATPSRSKLGFDYNYGRMVQPIDYNGYRDSISQYQIYDGNKSLVPKVKARPLPL